MIFKSYVLEENLETLKKVKIVLFYGENLGLKKEFDAQLTKMRHQDKHKYKEVRDRWQYAYNKVTKLSKKK